MKSLKLSRIILFISLFVGVTVSCNKKAEGEISPSEAHNLEINLPVYKQVKPMSNGWSGTSLGSRMDIGGEMKFELKRYLLEDGTGVMQGVFAINPDQGGDTEAYPIRLFLIPPENRTGLSTIVMQTKGLIGGPSVNNLSRDEKLARQIHVQFRRKVGDEDATVSFNPYPNPLSYILYSGGVKRVEDMPHSDILEKHVQ